MKNLRAAGVALFALATIDVAGARSPDPPPVAPTWSGCYAGANGGFAWSQVGRTYNDPNPTQDPINGIPGGQATIPTPAGGSAFGGLGGIGGGCNWESPQRVVLGVEGDFDYANISLRQSTSGPLANYQTGTGTTTFATNFSNLNESITPNWLSTIRARIGYAVQDRVLLFATGGAAIGQVQNQGLVQLGSTPQVAAGTFPIWTGSNTTIKGGFALGGGAEWMALEHWTIKAEYLWYDLGTVSHPLNCATPTAGFCGPGFFYPTLGNVVSSIRGSIVRVGFNYKFW
jgi:outer membrane immunogenic protein